MKPFVVNIADLIYRPASRRHEHISGPTDTLVVAQTVVPAGASMTVTTDLAAVSDGILATGTVEVDWESTCRRCLIPVSGRVKAKFRELYSEHPVEGETYPVTNETIDLELVAREAILLDLPLAPACRQDCAGLCPTCGIDRNDGSCDCEPPTRDQRWAALDGLRIDAANN